MFPRQFLLAAVAAASLVALRAQTPTGNIEGVVTDPSGGLVPGASVAVVETATGRKIPLATNGEGRYAARNLLPGQYDLLVEASGFAAKYVRQVSVSAGSVVTMDVALELTAQGVAVSVTAGQFTVDVVRHVLDSVVTGDQIKNMPLFARNFLDLAALAPGTEVRDGKDIDVTKAGNYRGVGIAGRSGMGTRVQVDGIDINDEVIGSTVANYSPDSVSEFQLSRSSLDPSTSLTSSGAVSIISPSGGNAVHGSGFWDYYNQDLGARLEYTPTAVPFDRNRVGGAASGPFIKDRLFWWAGLERHYQQEQKINSNPNFPQLNVTQGFPVGVRYADARVDWNIRPALRLFARFHHDWNLATGGTAVSPFQNINWTNTTTVGLDLSRARFTNSFRFGYVNFNGRIVSNEMDFKFPRTPDGAPYYLTVGTHAAGWNRSAPQSNYQSNLQFSYEGNWFRGRHLLRYGFDARRMVPAVFLGGGIMSVSGTYSASTIAAVAARGGNTQDPLEYPLQNILVTSPQGYALLDAAHGMPHGGAYNSRFGSFVQDSIKIGRRLSLNLGVRWWYETRYFQSPDVPRDPILDRWIPGASRMPELPGHMFSPSLGFAWDVSGGGKTVIRGGFYQAYEKKFITNEEAKLLPPGLGSQSFDLSYVTGPDGVPINVDGRHPDGDYTDLSGLPIKNVIRTLGALQAEVRRVYNDIPFDPNKGESSFRLTKGDSGLTPGNQAKIPYSLQFNVGVQRQLGRNLVLSADYVQNHGVGVPRLGIDYERRRDASTLNVNRARTQINALLGGRTVDQWIAANPNGTIATFRLTAGDDIYAGLYPDFITAGFTTGGFSQYRAMQISLRGRGGQLGPIGLDGINVGYALARTESVGAGRLSELTLTSLDNRNWNAPSVFGPTTYDRTHLVSAALSVRIPGGFQIYSNWTFRSANPVALAVPPLGATTGTNAYFGTDLNGDGVATDLFPGLDSGRMGRTVKSFEQLNSVIQSFNQALASRLTPHGQALVTAGLFTEDQLKRLGAVVPTVPLIPLTNPSPFHNIFLCDLRLSRPLILGRWREGMSLAPFADFYNLFNHAPSGLYGNGSGLYGRFGDFNYDYASAPAGRQVADLASLRGRLNPTRKVMIGVRFLF